MSCSGASARWSVITVPDAHATGSHLPTNRHNSSATRAGFASPSIEFVLWLGGAQLGACTHARACLHGRNEADLVQSVIEPGRRVRRYHAELHDHGGDQRQGQITMRDRTAERTFTFGAL